jgi:Ca2+-binding RTX toxin-like protein
LTLSTVGAAAGTADTITIITDGNTAIDYGQFALSGYETITINATQSTADAANLRIATMGLNVTQAGGAQSTVNFTGTESVTLSEALDAQIVSSTGLTGALIMGASSTAGSQTITGGSGADTLVGSSSGDTINGGAGVDIITGNAGNDVIDGGSGADEISADAGINIVTGGAGADDVHLTTATTGIAVQLTTVTDFNAGTSTTGVDQVEFDLSELNLANGDLAGAVGFMTTGLGADNGGANSSRLAAGGGVLTTQRVTGDGQTGLAATELFLIDNGATYENDNAFETALAAGQVTFSTGTVDDNDAILIAYTSTAGHVNVGIGQFAGTTGSSDTIDGFQTLVTLESVSMANLDSSDFLITG